MLACHCPNDAVMRTTVPLRRGAPGRQILSVVEVDLQTAVQRPGVPRQVRAEAGCSASIPVAVFTVEDIGGIPDGLAEGEEVATTGGWLAGGPRRRLPTHSSRYRRRDDGDSLFILGRTTFTWDQLEVPRPEARSVVSIEDEVRVEILLASRSAIADRPGKHQGGIAMKAVQVSQTGGPEVLEYRDVDDPVARVQARQIVDLSSFGRELYGRVPALGRQPAGSCPSYRAERARASCPRWARASRRLRSATWSLTPAPAHRTRRGWRCPRGGW